jgi:hypothetical protein
MIKGSIFKEIHTFFSLPGKLDGLVGFIFKLYKMNNELYNTMCRVSYVKGTLNGKILDMVLFLDMC